MRTVLVLAILLATAPAHADDVGVVVTGEATLQPPLAASLEGWLREHGHKLVSSPLEADAINALIDCFVLEDLGCARTVIEKRSKSQTIVYARVEVGAGGKGMGNVTLVGYWLQKGHEAVGERRTCKDCNQQQLTVAADDLMSALAAEPPPADPNAAPAPAPAPAAAAVAAQAQAQVETGAPAMLWPKALVGGGAVLAVTGGVMLAMNGTPARTGVQQPTYRDWGPPGYALLGTGAVAIGVGVYLWFHERRSSAPVAAVTPGGAVVGWTGRF